MTNSSVPDWLIDRVETVIHDAEELLEAASAEAGEPVKGMRARLRESLHRARKSLLGAERRVLRNTEEAVTAANRYTHANPWRIVAIATSVGLLVGLVIGGSGARR